MRLDKLTLDGWRNYQRQTLAFDQRCNVIYGENAQGKTNLLEAAVYLSCGKSPRAHGDRELIGFERQDASLTGQIFSRDRAFTTEIQLFRGKRRKMTVNGVPAKTGAALSDVLHTVFFCPEDLFLIRAGAAERRRFMDLSLCQLRPRYAEALAEYTRLHEHKTRILRDSEEHPQLLQMLPDFNERLCRVGAVLISYRARYCVSLAEYARQAHFECSGEKEELTLLYRTVKTVEDPFAPQEQICEALRRHQEAHLAAERASRLCLSGPHKDDLVITICFSRYTAQIAEGAAFLHAHDVPIVLMTDLEPSPLYAYAACTLQCEALAEGYFPCYAGCLSILYALCSTLGSMRGTDAAEHARELERVLLDRGVFL